MSKLEDIKKVLGNPDRTYDDVWNRQLSYWWRGRSEEDAEKVKEFGAEKCHSSSTIYQRDVFDINYVENKT